MKKYILLFLSFCLGIVTLIGFNINPVSAAAAPATVNYSVSPEVAGNQIDKKITYYDLKVTPGQSESIKFKINNTDTADHTYTVAINRATTDVNGVIDYTRGSVKQDSDLKYNIEKLVTYPKKVAVAAKTSKEVTVKLNVPEGKFPGEILGGILVDEDNQVNNKAPNGVTLKSKYDYVIGLQLQENMAAIKSDLKLDKVYETSQKGQIYLDDELDNDVPKLEKNVSISARVTPVNSNKTILSANKKNMSLAPDSNFDYPVDVNQTTGADRNKRLKPGTYTMYLDAKANNGQNLWNFKRKFTISSVQNKRVNKVAPNNSNAKWMVIGIVAALIVVAGGIIWYYRKNKK